MYKPYSMINTNDCREEKTIKPGNRYQTAELYGLSPEKITDFSGTENYFASQLTSKLAAGITPDILHLPDSRCKNLVDALARHEQLEPEQILCGSGAGSLFRAALSNFAPGNVSFIGIPEPEYITICESLGITYHLILPDVEDGFLFTERNLRRIWDCRSELAVLSSPDIQSGTANENLAAILAAIRSPLIILDLSLREFIRNDPEYDLNNWRSCQHLINSGARLVCLHSFKDFFAAPGLNLGYLSGEAQVLKKIERYLPWCGVDTFSQLLGLGMLEKISEYHSTIQELAIAKYALGQELKNCKLFNLKQLVEGQAFFCCGLKTEPEILRNLQLAAGKNTSESMSEKLQRILMRRGLLIHNFAFTPGMPVNFIRIQVRRQEENNNLLDALSKLP